MTTEDAIQKLWRGDISELPSAAGLALALLKQRKTAKSTHGA